MLAVSIFKLVLSRLPRAIVYLAFGEENDLAAPAPASAQTTTTATTALGKSDAEAALEAMEATRAARMAKDEAQ